MSSVSYKIFESGGKQYRVAVGSLVRLEKLNQREGEEVLFDKVLFAAQGDSAAKSDDAAGSPQGEGHGNNGGADSSSKGNGMNTKTEFGTPYLANQTVRAVVIRHARSDKIRIIKFKRRKHSLKRQGHRQWFTEVLILGADEKPDSDKVTKLRASLNRPVRLPPPSGKAAALSVKGTAKSAAVTPAETSGTSSPAKGSKLAKGSSVASEPAAKQTRTDTGAGVELLLKEKQKDTKKSSPTVQPSKSEKASPAAKPASPAIDPKMAAKKPGRSVVGKLFGRRSAQKKGSK